jgi:nicotinamidase/pyrazinamidase
MSSEVLFLDVDTQHDFMDADGKLPVPGARSIVPNLRKLTTFAVERGVPILATADAHPPGDPEFAQFGEHCVPGTRGQRRIRATSPAARQTAAPDRLAEQVAGLASGRIAQLIIEKQALDVFTVPMTDQALAALGPARVYVYGVATEYCVRAEVLGLRQRGYDVTVVTDALGAVRQEDGEKALAEMRAAGASMADTQTVLRTLAAETED